MIKLHYDALLGLLEAAYARVRLDHPLYGEGARDAWQTARRGLLDAHGWTETEFYAELDARRAAQG